MAPKERIEFKFEFEFKFKTEDLAIPPQNWYSMTWSQSEKSHELDKQTLKP